MMFGMFINSAKLFFAGRLFRDNRAVLMQWLKGFALSLALMLAVGWVVSPLAGTVVTGLVGGALQPLLFKDLKWA
jgi:hypothetical protein